MSAAEIVQIDLVAPAAERHPVLEGPLGQPFPVALLEDVDRRLLRAGVGLHLFHVGLRVVVCHDVDGRWKLDVAADVIGVAVRVDQNGHRLARQLPDLVEHRAPPPGILRVHDDDPIRRDENGRIAAASFEHEQVVFEFLDLDDLGLFAGARGLLRRRDGERRGKGKGQRTDADQHAQDDASCHASLQEKRRLD